MSTFTFSQYFFQQFLPILTFSKYFLKRIFPVEVWRYPTLIISWFIIFKFKSCETFTVMNSVTRTLLIEALSKFRTIKCWFTLHLHMYVKVSINSNILDIPPSFLAFHIPLTFALYQLKISEKCTVSTNRIEDVLHFNINRNHLLNEMSKWKVYNGVSYALYI